jgi:aldehyde:ferredoxin oxidoreductase
MKSYAGKVLRVDLTKEKILEKELSPDLLSLYLGGKGLAARFLYDDVPPATDPFAPENEIIFMTGPLTGTLAPGNRFTIVTKSPLTGTFLDSYAGGHFGQELKYAGYDGVIVTGRSQKPAYIWIDDGEVELKDASSVWGKDTRETSKEIASEVGYSDVKIACIGPAGENLVRFACTVIDPYSSHAAGRGGTGAIMGSKRLKAVAVKGSGEIEIADFKRFEEALLSAYEAIKRSPDSQAYANLGTPGFVGFANEEGFFSTRNYQDVVFEDAENIAGESQKNYLWIRGKVCFACVIPCTKVGIVRKGKFAQKVAGTVEYESTALLGANCGIGDLRALVEANMLCDSLGLDTISTGNVIAFATECYEKGLLPKDQFGGLEPKFGDGNFQQKMIMDIAHRRGIGDLLAEGVKRASEKIGEPAKALAVHIKGLETPAWDPRSSPAMGLALATADRGGCHERSWPITYELGAVWPGGRPLERFSLEGKAEVVKWEQDYLAALYSLVACDFTRSGIQPDIFVKMLVAATGWDIGYEEFMKVGERIWNLTRLFNVREGISRKDDNLPPRLKYEPVVSGPTKGRIFSDKDLNKLLKDYYALRGWDSQGRPTKDKLIELSL